MGADVNVKAQYGKPNVPQFLWPSFYDEQRTQTEPLGPIGVTPLHLAAWKGHRDMVKCLLEFLACPVTFSPGYWTPLYTALALEHEEIAWTISDRIEHVAYSFLDPERMFNPLHIACILGLPLSAQYYLRKGADINASDRLGTIPFDHALKIYRGNPFRTKDQRRSPQEVINLVKVLMEHGASMDREIPPIYSYRGKLRGEPTTIRRLGARHEYEEVRKLFPLEPAEGGSPHRNSILYRVLRKLRPAKVPRP
jgi:hypothetical protein